MRSKSVKVSEIVIPLQIKNLKDGSYLATSRILRGLVAQGRTLAETLEIAQDVARRLIESYQEHGDPLPSNIQKQINRKTTIFHIEVPVALPAY